LIFRTFASTQSNKRTATLTPVIDGRSYVTSHQYNSANQSTQKTYPSCRVIVFGHDHKGRITFVGSFLSGVTYNAIGQLTGTTLGNGVTENLGYSIFVALEFAAAVIAFLLEPKENKRLLVWSFWQRFFYRQLMYYVAIKSTLASLKEIAWDGRSLREKLR